MINVHALALEFCRHNSHCDVPTTEAAMNVAALAVADHALAVTREAILEIKALHEADARRLPAPTARHD